MNDFQTAIVVANIFRFLLVIVGLMFGWMGYRLFTKGYFERGGVLEAKFGGQHLLLKQVAPGVLFAGLGIAAIMLGVVRPIEIKTPTGMATMAKHYGNADQPCPEVGTEQYRSSKPSTKKQQDSTHRKLEQQPQ